MDDNTIEEAKRRLTEEFLRYSILRISPNSKDIGQVVSTAGNALVINHAQVSKLLKVLIPECLTPQPKFLAGFGYSRFLSEYFNLSFHRLPNGQNSVEYKKPQGAYLKKLQDSEVVYIAHFLKRGDEHAKGIELLRAQGITIKRLFTLLDYNLESTREIMECQKPYDSENTLSSEVKVQSILSLNEILRQELKSRKLKKTEYERVKEWQQEYQQRVLV